MCPAFSTAGQGYWKTNLTEEKPNCKQLRDPTATKRQEGTSWGQEQPHLQQICCCNGRSLSTTAMVICKGAQTEEISTRNYLIQSVFHSSFPLAYGCSSLWGGAWGQGGGGGMSALPCDRGCTSHVLVVRRDAWRASQATKGWRRS